MELLLIGVLAALAMEPFAVVAHRWLMHSKLGWVWHGSHHRLRRTTFEGNDWYPIVFASMTITTMAIGAGPGPDALLAAGAGVTAYGMAYLVVHDLFVHQRLKFWPEPRGRYLTWVVRAHALHHKTGAAPYGFLLPFVRAQDRALLTDGDAALRLLSGGRTAIPAPA